MKHCVRLHAALLLEGDDEVVQLVGGDGFELASLEVARETVENRFVLAIGVGLLERIHLVEVAISVRGNLPDSIGTGEVAGLRVETRPNASPSI